MSVNFKLLIENTKPISLHTKGENNMKEHLFLDFTDIEQSAIVAKALASDVRLRILDIIQEKPLNVSEIASKAAIPISTAALHIKILEEAGIVITQFMPGLRGSQRMCGLRVGKVEFTILNQEATPSSTNIITESIPIGNYFDCDITAPCGIVSDTAFLGSEDSPYGFYSPDKHTAQIIWFTKGYLEYRFSNYQLKKVKLIHSLSFSFEVCSEAPGYNNNWKSDISLWINHLDAGTFTSQGDFGGRKGKLNPDWWNDNMTQYGLLKTLLINDTGTFIDNNKASELTLADYNFKNNTFISFQIGVKENAKYLGGLNLFGNKFGDFPQNIVLEIQY